MYRLGLATQTVRGAAQLALESGLSPEELRRMVITPGGTTAAGLATMEKLGSAAGLARGGGSGERAGEGTVGETEIRPRSCRCLSLTMRWSAFLRAS